MKLPKRTFKKKMTDQHGRCYYCGDKLYVGNIEIDHFVAKSNGGSGCNNNLVLSCIECNRKKSNKLLRHLREYLYQKDKLIRNQFYFEFIHYHG
jgi:5-methylcytosine-specific restriction endonuclease McrA